MHLVPAQNPSDWDSAAEGYAELIAPITGNFTDQLLSAVNLSPGEKFLDVAAGTGTTAISAAKLGATVTAVDFSEAMVELIRKNALAAGVEVTASVMDGQNLNLQDNSFDAAISAFGLMFFPNLTRGFKELYRVLKAGGRAVVLADAPQSDDPFAQVSGQALLKVIPSLSEGNDEVSAGARLAQPGAMEEYFTNAGFKNVQIQTITSEMKIRDPEQFWLKLGPALPPLKPLFNSFDNETMAEVAKAFDEVLSDTKVDGVAIVNLGALLGKGTK